MILMILKEEGGKSIQIYVKDRTNSTSQKAMKNLKEPGTDRKPCLSIKIPEAKISNQYEIFLQYVDFKLEDIKNFAESITWIKPLRAKQI